MEEKGKSTDVIGLSEWDYSILKLNLGEKNRIEN